MTPDRDALRRPAASGLRAPMAQPSVTDAQLIARVVVHDDRHAFSELVRRHQSAIRATLRRLTAGNHALADDLAQETFLLAYRNLKSFRQEARFSTWLYRIATNAFLADARKRKEELLGDTDVEVAADEDEPASPNGRRVERRSRPARRTCGWTWNARWRSLSDGERAAIVQCYHNDLSHEEAAYVLNCPVGTVKTHLLRGKQKLKARLAAWAPEDAPNDALGAAPAGRAMRGESDERTNDTATTRTAADDWLERLLRDDGRDHRAGYLADDGFTARVAASLPPPATLPAWRTPAVAVLWAVAAGAASRFPARCRSRVTARRSSAASAVSLVSTWRVAARAGRGRGRGAAYRSAPGWHELGPPPDCAPRIGRLIPSRAPGRAMRDPGPSFSPSARS